MLDRLLKRSKDKDKDKDKDRDRDRDKDKEKDKTKKSDSRNSSKNVDNLSPLSVPLPSTPFGNNNSGVGYLDIPDMVINSRLTSDKHGSPSPSPSPSLPPLSPPLKPAPTAPSHLPADIPIIKESSSVKSLQQHDIIHHQDSSSYLKIPAIEVHRRNTIDNGFGYSISGHLTMDKSPSYEQSIVSLSPSLFSSIQSKGYMDEYYETDETLQRYLNSAWSGVVLPKSQALARIDLKFIVRRGVPDCKRASVWRLLTGYEELKNSPAFDLVSLALNGEGVPKKFRNIPSFGGILSPSDHFLTDEGIQQVKRILSITALNSPEVEYCPVIPDIVHILLIFMSDLEAYAILNLLIQQSKDNFYRYFNTNNRECTSFLLTFDSLVEIQIPKLYKHMIGLGVTNCSVFAEEWFSRLFVSHLPFQIVLRVFDCFLGEGYKALYRVALGLLMIHKRVLLKATSAEQFLSVLKNYNLQLNNPDELMKRAFSIHLKRRNLLSIDAKQTPKLRNVSEPELPIYYRPKITQPSSTILEEDHYEIIWAWLPHKYCICDPKVIFNSNKDGFNLRLLCERVENKEPIIIIIKTHSGEAFGFLTDGDLTPSDSFGSHDTFVFSLKPHIAVYKPSNKNELFFKVTSGANRELWVGQSEMGDHAILLDRDLNGITASCDTFDSPSFSESSKFTCATLEAITLV